MNRADSKKINDLEMHIGILISEKDRLTTENDQLRGRVIDLERHVHSLLADMHTVLEKLKEEGK